MINKLKNVSVPTGWKLYRIKDKLQKIGSGVTPKGGSEVYSQSGIPFFRSQNIHDAGLKLEKVSYISSEINDRMKNSQVRPGDILINITGASIGRSSTVPNSIKIANISQHMLFLRFKERYVDYISNYLQSNYLRQQIMSVQSGASKEALTMRQAMNLPLLMPARFEREKIVAYVRQRSSAIDKKISLLEAKANTFKELSKTIVAQTVLHGLTNKQTLIESKINWIGKLPKRWFVQRGKELFIEKTKKGYPHEPLLAASQKYGVVLKSMLDQKSMEAQKDFENFKLVNIDDFVISLRSFEGGIETAYYRGIISPVYTVFSLKNKNLFVGYFKYLFKSSVFITNLQTMITGIRDGQSIKFVEIQNTFFPVPPLEEQKEIAAYLDEKTKIIDLIISNINNQIEKLKEFRKTLINEVVTGKLKVTD